MRTRFVGLCSVASLAAVSVLATLIAPMTASGLASKPAAAQTGAADEGVWGWTVPAPVSRTVEIDGRFFTVEVSVTRVYPGAPLEGGSNGPWTTVTVWLSVQDGALLPEGLQVVGVRFEKLQGTNRFWFTDVDEMVAQTWDLQFEEDLKVYQGDLSDHPIVKRARTTVRLELDGRVIKVPMGIVNVGLIFAP